MTPDGALGLAALEAFGWVWIVAADLLAHVNRLKVRLTQLFRGDRAAAGRLWHWLRTVLKTIWGAETKGV